jgi:hypothetical protein
VPTVTPPPYPKSLTTASWDKAKGVIARISKVKTGVTEELQTAAKAFAAAPFATLNVSPLVLNKTFDAKGLKQLQDDYLRKYQPEFKKLEAVFYELSQTLKKKAGDFDKDDKLKKFSPVLTLMANDANKFTYAVAWGTVSTPNQRYLQEMIDAQVKTEKMWAEAGKKLKTMIDTASSKANGFKSKTPKVADYSTFWKEELRGIGAQIAMAAKSDPTILTRYAVPMGIAKKQWADSSLPKKDDEVAEQVKKDIDLLKKYKTISDAS